MAITSIESVVGGENDQNTVPERPEVAPGPGQEVRVGKDETEYEVVDDTPARDRGRAPRAPGTPSRVPTDEEINAYSRQVKDKIRNLKWEWNEERRIKEAAQREQQAAVEFAKQVFEENQRLKQTLSTGHKTMIDATKSSAESEITSIRGALARANESGDQAGAAELQERLSRAAARAEAASREQPVNFREEKFPDARFNAGGRVPAPPQVILSQSAQEWKEKNPWFQREGDEDMTSLAFGVHEKILKKGVKVDSPTYYTELDAAIKKSFPERFTEDGAAQGGEDDDPPWMRQEKPARQEQAPPARRAPNVTVNAARTPPGGSGGKVQLTTSEMKLAQKLGVSPAAFAAEKRRLTEQ